MNVVIKEEKKTNDIMYCEIQNDGEVDVNAFKLMGATTKNENQIGYFGSGIKYALATALRSNIPIKIFKGEKEVKITTRKTKMRDLNFNIICVNGSPTSITTQMGRDWLPWFIFREFYCNAIDEGGEELNISKKPQGIAGKTRIYIGFTAEIKSVFSQQEKYFSNKRESIHQTRSGKVFNRIDEEMVIYRRGIKVFNNGNSLYDYDFISLSINEAREASDFNVKWGIVDLWKTQPTKNMLAALVNNRNCLEFDLDWSWGFSNMSSVWLEYLKDKIIIPAEHSGYFADDLSNYHVILSHKLCIELHKQFGSQLIIRGMVGSNESKITEIPIQDKFSIMINEAMKFLKQISYFQDIDSRFQIKVAILDRETLGIFNNGIIYLSEDVFLKGKKSVITTLAEEFIHGKNEVFDRTRSMQDTLIEILVSAIEEKSEQYL